MEDQISRQKLIDDITAGEYTTGNIFKDMELQQFIKDQPPADPWIPCSERPPEEPCFYTVEDRSPYTLKRHGKPRRKVVTVKPYMWDVYDHVVAWKPIDMEPYKGGIEYEHD